MRFSLLIAIAGALLIGVVGSAQAQKVSTTCTPFTAPPAKAAADSATVRIIRPANTAGIDDAGNIRLYMPPDAARLDLTGKIQQVFDCPGNTVGYRLVPTKADGDKLVFEIPVRADVGDLKVVACYAKTGNCWRGDVKPGGEVTVVAYDRPDVTPTKSATDNKPDPDKTVPPGPQKK